MLLALVMLSRPGVVLGGVLAGVSLSGLVGDTRPWMVPETRAETVLRFWGGEAGLLWGLVEAPGDEAGVVAAISGPFSDTPGCVLA